MTCSAEEYAAAEAVFRLGKDSFCLRLKGSWPEPGVPPRKQVHFVLFAVRTMHSEGAIGRRTFDVHEVGPDGLRIFPREYEVPDTRWASFLKAYRFVTDHALTPFLKITPGWGALNYEDGIHVFAWATKQKLIVEHPRTDAFSSEPS